MKKTTLKIETRPIAPSIEDERRQQHTADRKKLLLGDWEDLLETELYEHLSTDRRQAWGKSDLSSNLAESLTRELSVLYHEYPSITNGDNNIEAITSRDGILAPYWPMMMRQQQFILFLRESFSRIDYVPPMGNQPPRLAFRIVTPDVVYCESHPDDPDVPNYYQELRLRRSKSFPDYDAIYTADIFDLRDPANPRFEIRHVETDGSLGINLTSEYIGKDSLSGDDYIYRYADGSPFIPATLYHAEKTGELWDAYSKNSLYSGSLSSAVLYTMWFHVVRDSAFNIKYVAGLSLQGLNQMDQDLPARRAAISTDPSSILVFNSDPDLSGQPLIGQFSPSADPTKMMEAIQMYERRAAAAFNISANMLRSSGDPRSGYALSIDKSGKREAQRSFAPVFRLFDEEFIAKTAAMSNRLLGTNLPEKGYRIKYAPIPLSPSEMDALRKDIMEKMKAGLLSKVDAYIMLNPDCDREEAAREIERIKKENILYG